MTKWVSGTATGFNDLLTKFIDHITNDPDLVAAGENWSQAWNTGSQYVFQSPLGVCFGLDAFTDGSIYEWRLFGMTAPIASAPNLYGHENSSSTYKRILLDDFSMAYWMAMSARRIALVVKVSTYYESAYLGWLLPYTVPAEWPQPLFIGGCAGEKLKNADPGSWTDTGDGHRCYISSPSDADYDTPAGMYLTPTLSWVDLNLRKGTAQHVTFWPRRTTYGHDDAYEPVDPALTEHFAWPPTIHGYARKAPNNEKVLWPLHLFNEPDGYIAGALDGVYAVNGDGLTPETTLTIGGQSYFIFPDVFRQTEVDFYALEMA